MLSSTDIDKISSYSPDDDTNAPSSSALPYSALSSKDIESIESQDGGPGTITKDETPLGQAGSLLFAPLAQRAGIAKSFILGAGQGAINTVGGAENLLRDIKGQPRLNLWDIRKYASNPAAATIGEYIAPMAIPVGGEVEGLGLLANAGLTALKSGALGAVLGASKNAGKVDPRTLDAQNFLGSAAIGGALHTLSGTPSSIMGPAQEATEFVSSLKGGSTPQSVGDDILNSVKKDFANKKAIENSKYKAVDDLASSVGSNINYIPQTKSYAADELNKIRQGSSIVDEDQELSNDLQKIVDSPVGLSFMGAKKAGETFLSKAQSSDSPNARRIYYNLRSKLLGGKSEDGSLFAGDVEKNLISNATHDMLYNPKSDPDGGAKLLRAYQDARDFTRDHIVPYSDDTQMSNLLSAPVAPNNIHTVLSKPINQRAVASLPQNIKDKIAYRLLMSKGAADYSPLGNELSSPVDLADSTNKILKTNPGSLAGLLDSDKMDNLRSIASKTAPLNAISAALSRFTGGKTLGETVGGSFNRENPSGNWMAAKLKDLMSSPDFAAKFSSKAAIPLINTLINSR